MRIGEVAQETGVSARSLRYYEEQGLIRAARSSGGWREYDASTVERVILIQHLFAAGLTSRTIAELLPCLEASPQERTGMMDNLLSDEINHLECKRRDIDRELDTLRALRADVKV